MSRPKTDRRFYAHTHKDSRHTHAPMNKQDRQTLTYKPKTKTHIQKHTLKRSYPLPLSFTFLTTPILRACSLSDMFCFLHKCLRDLLK